VSEQGLQVLSRMTLRVLCVCIVTAASTPLSFEPGPGQSDWLPGLERSRGEPPTPAPPLKGGFCGPSGPNPLEQSNVSACGELYFQGVVVLGCLLYFLKRRRTTSETSNHTEGAIYSGSVHLHMTLLSVLSAVLSVVQVGAFAALPPSDDDAVIAHSVIWSLSFLGWCGAIWFWRRVKPNPGAQHWVAVNWSTLTLVLAGLEAAKYRADAGLYWLFPLLQFGASIPAVFIDIKVRYQHVERGGIQSGSNFTFQPGDFARKVLNLHWFDGSGSLGLGYGDAAEGLLGTTRFGADKAAGGPPREFGRKGGARGGGPENEPLGEGAGAVRERLQGRLRGARKWMADVSDSFMEGSNATPLSSAPGSPVAGGGGGGGGGQSSEEVHDGYHALDAPQGGGQEGLAGGGGGGGRARGNSGAGGMFDEGASESESGSSRRGSFKSDASSSLSAFDQRLQHEQSQVRAGAAGADGGGRDDLKDERLLQPAIDGALQVRDVAGGWWRHGHFSYNPETDTITEHANAAKSGPPLHSWRISGAVDVKQTRRLVRSKRQNRFDVTVISQHDAAHGEAGDEPSLEVTAVDEDGSLVALAIDAVSTAGHAVIDAAETAASAAVGVVEAAASAAVVAAAAAAAAAGVQAKPVVRVLSFSAGKGEKGKAEKERWLATFGMDDTLTATSTLEDDEVEDDDGDSTAHESRQRAATTASVLDSSEAWEAGRQARRHSMPRTASVCDAPAAGAGEPAAAVSQEAAADESAECEFHHESALQVRDVAGGWWRHGYFVYDPAADTIAEHPDCQTSEGATPGPPLNVWVIGGAVDVVQKKRRVRSKRQNRFDVTVVRVVPDPAKEAAEEARQAAAALLLEPKAKQDGELKLKKHTDSAACDGCGTHDNPKTRHNCKACGDVFCAGCVGRRKMRDGRAHWVCRCCTREGAAPAAAFEWGARVGMTLAEGRLAAAAGAQLETLVVSFSAGAHAQGAVEKAWWLEALRGRVAVEGANAEDAESAASTSDGGGSVHSATFMSTSSAGDV
jgi:hypothetical protein